MNITAVATDSGISILKGNFKDTVKDFIIIGSESTDNKALDNIVNDKNSDYAKIKDHIIFKDKIKSAYYDTKGVLTFELVLPYEGDFKKYIYAVGLISTDNVLVSISKTPKIYKTTGLGGTFTYKVAINGTPADIVYNNTDILFATDDEAKKGDVRLKAIDPYQLRNANVANAEKLLTPRKINDVPFDGTKDIAISLAPIGYVYVQYPDQLAPNELFGGTWENISSQYAGRFFRAEGGNAGTFGDNQGDAIRNISGWIGSICTYVNDPTSAIGVHSVIENRDYPRGSTQAAHIVFDASRQVPTAEENRPINTAIRLWKRIA